VGGQKSLDNQRFQAKVEIFKKIFFIKFELKNILNFSKKTIQKLQK